MKSILEIADAIEEYGNAYITHLNNNVKIFAASRLVDIEIAKRMESINRINKETGFLVVGGVK